MRVLGKSKKQNDDVPARRKSTGGDISFDDQRSNSSDLSSRYTFRRNRTLTGSSSASVASSNELNAELRSPRAHVHHLTSLRRRLLGYFSIVAMAAFAIYLLLSQLAATEIIQVKGVSLLSADDTLMYQKTLDSYYSARPAERLRFMLNEADLLAHIQSTQPEVKAVTVEPGGRLGEAVFAITARQPIARWSIDNVNQYVDDEGIVFARSYHGDPHLQIIDDSGIQTSSERRLIASNRFLGFVGRVIAGASTRGLDVKSVTIPLGTTRQVTLSLTNSTTVYKLSVDRSAGQQVEDIARVSGYLATKRMNPGYVDLRIAGKAYYK